MRQLLTWLPSRVVGATGGGGVKPVYSPDGSRIVFVCVHDGEDGICTMDADDTNITSLVDEPGVAENRVVEFRGRVSRPQSVAAPRDRQGSIVPG